MSDAAVTSQSWHRSVSRSRCLRKVAPAALILTACVAFGAQVQAQPWPSRTVRIVVPYAAGGNSDVMARVVAQRLTEAFGQTFIVENRVGANGALAADTVIRAGADGYTLLWAVTPPMTIAPAMTKLSYDPIKDFAPISAVATNGFVLVVHKDFPPKTVAEFIAHVKAQKEKMSYAEGTAGSVTHLAMALFANRAGLDMTNISYRGNAPAMNDVIAGHLKTLFSNLSDALPHAASGAIRLLAVSTAQRAPQAATVPTVAESGLPGFNVITWNGLVAPAGTPREIVDKIAGEIGHAVKDPQFAGRLKAAGADPLGNTPDEFAAMIKADTATWADAVAVTGLKAQ
jgi:tripartite-type tricarboxylate transporter receptor subunit TctC